MVESSKNEATWKEIPAREILDKIMKGEPVEYTQVIIKDDINFNVPTTELEKFRDFTRARGFGSYQYKECIDVKVVGSIIRITGSEILGNTFFSNTIFTEYIDFTGTEFRGAVAFHWCEFSKDVIFQFARFIKNVSIFGSKFSKNAFFTYSSFEKKCIAQFERVQFSGDVDFKYAQFGGDANFRESQFKGEVDFNAVRFGGDANFSDSQFKIEVDFRIAQFEGDANFSESQFKGEVDFNAVRFGGNANFSKSQFKGEVDFKYAQFEDDANFSESRFRGDALFAGSLFSEVVNFEDSQFDNDAIFVRSQFNKIDTQRRIQALGASANFKRIRVRRNALFENAQLKSSIDFSESQIEGETILADATFSGMIINRRSRIRKLYIRWPIIKNRLLQDDEAYVSLVENYKQLGWLEDADDCYYSYRVNHQKPLQKKLIMNAKSLFHRNLIQQKITLQFLGECLSDFFRLVFEIAARYSYGYGVKPELPLLWSMLIILLFGGIFLLTNATSQVMSFESTIFFSANIFTSGASSLITGASASAPIVEPVYAVIMERILGWVFFGLFLTSIAKTIIR